MPSRPAKRLIRTITAHETASTGRTTARRASVTTSPSSQAIPDKVNFVVIKNAGAGTVQLNFSGDGAGNYWTLATNQITPAIGLGEGVTINARTVSGTATLECIFWG